MISKADFVLKEGLRPRTSISFTFAANSYVERHCHGQTKEDDVSRDSKAVPTKNINTKLNFSAEPYGMRGKEIANQSIQQLVSRRWKYIFKKCIR